jgi:hypothetical protein
MNFPPIADHDAAAEPIIDVAGIAISKNRFVIWLKASLTGQAVCTIALSSIGSVAAPYI